MTRRMLAAIANPHLDILGHCTGRKVAAPAGLTGAATAATGPAAPGRRATSTRTAVFAACVEHGKAVEINCRPDRLDPPKRLLGRALRGRLPVRHRHRRARAGPARLAAIRLRAGRRCAASSPSASSTPGPPTGLLGVDRRPTRRPDSRWRRARRGRRSRDALGRRPTPARTTTRADRLVPVQVLAEHEDAEHRGDDRDAGRSPWPSCVAPATRITRIVEHERDAACRARRARARSPTTSADRLGGAGGAPGDQRRDDRRAAPSRCSSWPGGERHARSPASAPMTRAACTGSRPRSRRPRRAHELADELGAADAVPHAEHDEHPDEARAAEADDRRRVGRSVRQQSTATASTISGVVRVPDAGERPTRPAARRSRRG